MVKMSGGEALAKSLVNEGVEVVFGIPGVQIYGIVAGIRDEPNLRMITTRHEQATTYMADGYARASGKPGVALVVPGVGVYNAASGLAGAYSRSIPVLLIAGQIPRGMIGKNLGAVHEVANQAEVVGPVTKWRRQVSRPREAPDAVFEAFRQMRTGRPRPVLIEMPPEAGVEREEVQLRNPAGESSTLVNINIDDTELTRIQSNTIPLHGDARATIEALLPPLIEAGAGERRSPARAVAAARRLIAYFGIREEEPQYPILEAIQRGVPEDAFVVWDVSQLGFYARTHHQANHPKTYVDPGYSFNLGYSFPTALGVKVAQPERSVVCVAGDGGFMFNSSELSTAVRYGINVVTVILRNDSYGNVESDLNNTFGGTYETDLHNPDFVRFAESFGAVGMRTEDPLELERLIPRALELDAPVVIDAQFGEMSLPRAHQYAFVYHLPWTQPQEGLIQS